MTEKTEKDYSETALEEAAADDTADGAGKTAADEAVVDEAEIEALNRDIERLCISKAEEFHLLGYENVTGKEIWDCVSSKYTDGAYPPLHRLVNDILSLKPHQFMNWMTLKIYKRET